MTGNSSELVKLQGTGYDQRLVVRDEFGEVVFRGYADDLVTSAREALSLRLNFGEDSLPAFAFRMFRAGDSVILVQPWEAVVQRAESGIGARRGSVVLPLATLHRLWEALRYDARELAALQLADTSTLATAWIHGAPLLRETAPSPEEQALLLSRAIVAESADFAPSVRAVLGAFAARSLVTDPEIRRLSPAEVTTVAFVEYDGVVAEWQALSRSRDTALVVDGHWSARISPRMPRSDLT